MSRGLSFALSLVALSACATYIDAKRQQPPLFEVTAPTPGVGILSVDVEDDVMARAPSDFSNMSGLFVKAVKDYFASQNASTPVVNYTDLGYRPKWLRNPAHDPMPFKLDSLPGIPAGVQTPVVSVVKVLDWRTYIETVDKKSIDKARVSLLISTWTKEGEPIRTEVVTGEAAAKDLKVMLSNHPVSYELVFGYERSLPDRRGFLPEEREKLFPEALQAATGLHYFPFLPQQVSERIVLIDDEPYKEGVLAAQSGRFDEALASWTKVYEADPKAHGALYNAAMMHLLRGDDARAAELLQKAIAIDDKFLYTQRLSSVKSRLAMRKRFGAAP